jgi:ribosomal protein S18 acetylase RimI-like enzyme
MNGTLRRATRQDIPGIVAAHASAFPGFFLTLLGPRFLGLFYGAFVADPRACLLVAEGEGGVVGFLAGVRDPELFFRRLRARRGPQLLMSAVPALLRHPLRVAERLLSAIVYLGDRPPDLPGYWLLSSIGVRSDAARGGVGARLLDRYLEEASQGGAGGVYLLTDGRDNDSALRFYGRRGFRTHASLRRRDGRELLVLTRSIST